MPNIALSSPENIFGLLTTTIFITILLSQLQQKYSEHDKQHGDHKQHYTKREKRQTHHSSEERGYGKENSRARVFVRTFSV